MFALKDLEYVLQSVVWNSVFKYIVMTFSDIQKVERMEMLPKLSQI